MQALQKVGGPLGTAILGSVLSTAYQGQLNLAGLPPALGQAVKASLFGGLAVAKKLGSAALLDSVRSAFVFGMDRSLVVAAGVAAAGMLLTLIFLPGRARTSGATAPVVSTASQQPGEVVSRAPTA
jgi:hypothetical protein